MPKLLIRSGDTSEFRHLSIKDGEVISVGRYNTNDLCLPHQSVSNFHALIICVDGSATMKDLKSTNGTKVNGKPIQMQTLCHLDDITIGTYLISYSDSGIGSSRLACDETSTAATGASETETKAETETVATQLPPVMKNNWIAIQEKSDYPVNAIGLKIQPSDTKAMQVWMREEIDKAGRLSFES